MTIDTEIDVNVSDDRAYELWSDFGAFPQYFKVIKQVGPSTTTPGHMHWVVEILGVEREFDVEVTEQIPGRRVAWSTSKGTEHSGVVTFHHLDDASCRVKLQMQFEPEGLIEQIADKAQIARLAADYELGEFKKIAEKTTN